MCEETRVKNVQRMYRVAERAHADGEVRLALIIQGVASMYINGQEKMLATAERLIEVAKENLDEQADTHRDN